MSNAIDQERLDDTGNSRLTGLLRAGDPNGEVRMAWHAKEVVRSIYEIDDPGVAADFVTRLALDLQDCEMPLEVRSLGRTLKRWQRQIVPWHQAHVTNGPTEGANNLTKRIKRGGFGFRNFTNYRIRVLLRRPPQLAPPRHRHTPLKSDEPVYDR